MNQIDLQPFVIEREWTVDDIPVLTAKITIPQPIPTTENRLRRMQRYYRFQGTSYLRYCEKWILPQAKAEYRAALAASIPFSCFHVTMEYFLTYQTDELLSLYTQSKEHTIAHRSYLTRRGDTWNLSSGFLVPLSDFFLPRAPWKRQLLRVAAEEIHRQETQGISQYHDGWQQKLRRSLNPQNYYLSPEGLTFFFPMYSIAPASEGIPTFTLPYSETTLQDIFLPTQEQLP